MYDIKILEWWCPNDVKRKGDDIGINMIVNMVVVYDV